MKNTRTVKPYHGENYRSWGQTKAPAYELVIPHNSSAEAFAPTARITIPRPKHGQELPNYKTIGVQASVSTISTWTKSVFVRPGSVIRFGSNALLLILMLGLRCKPHSGRKASGPMIHSPLGPSKRTANVSGEPAEFIHDNTSGVQKSWL